MISTTSPARPAPPNRPPPVLQVWREETLALVIRLILLVAAPVLVAMFIVGLQGGQFGLFLATLAAAGLAGWLAFERRLPYRARAYGILAILALYAALTLFGLGLVGSGRLHVLFVAFLAAVLLPRREVFAVWAAVGLLAVSILGGMAVGLVPDAPWAGGTGNPTTILVNTLTLLWFMVAVGVPLTALITRLSGSLAAAQAALAERDAVNARLEELVEQRTDELRGRVGELAALNQLAQALMGWTDLPEAMGAVGPLLLKLFGAGQVAIWLRDERGEALAPLALVAPGAVTMGGPAVPLAQAPRARAALGGRLAQILGGEEPDPVLLPAGLAGPVLAQPLVVRGAPIGLLAVHGGPGRPLTSADVELGQTVAGLLSSAIENGRLMQQTLAAAAAEERRRLARELHDSVTQQLAGLTLLAPSWAKLAARGHTAEVGDWFRQVEAMALQALKEMRLLIYQLRSEELEAQGLVAALRRRVEAVEGRAGVRISLDADEDLPRLAPEREAELFAIAQEALNNAARHARARAIAVAIGRAGQDLTLSISDDGQGFDPAAPSAGLGMITMRERAARLGGAWELRSAPGAGTTVTVTAPLRAPSIHVAAPAAPRRSP